MQNLFLIILAVCISFNVGKMGIEAQKRSFTPPHISSFALQNTKTLHDLSDEEKYPGQSTLHLRMS